MDMKNVLASCFLTRSSLEGRVSFSSQAPEQWNLAPYWLLTGCLLGAAYWVLLTGSLLLGFPFSLLSHTTQDYLLRDDLFTN